jgi:hypothetical protein
LNKYEKEVEKVKLAEEAREMKALKAMYEEAADQIARNIKITDGKMETFLHNWDNLSDDDKSVFTSKIYQKNFQKQLQSQINGVLKDLNSGQYKSIDEYLKKCYETGFIGAMYDIAGQGIPIIAPIDQKKVIKAIRTNSKISKGLYTKLGEDVGSLQKRIASSISRGIATSDSYENIARNIAGDSKVGYNRAMRIARTEGHRIHGNSAFDAQLAAKDAGADIVKQWDSVMDGNTRTTHRLLDGQIREVEEPFEMGSMKAMYPSDFGRPEEDINCRCVSLQRATWALDDDELAVLREKAKYHGTLVDDSKKFGHVKAKDFSDFRTKYLIATNKTTEFFKKTIIEDSFDIVYNNSPDKEAYNRAIRIGELTPLADFPLYQAISKQIDEKVVGVVVANGLTVASKSDHFVARTIGSVEQSRNGVSIDDIILALTNPDRIDPVKTRENGKTQRFILNGVCAVTINPETGNLIQVNPLR